MTAETYTEHADSTFDPDAPILGQTHLEARDNLKACMGGGTDAPRLQLLALARLVEGEAIRLRGGATIDAAGASLPVSKVALTYYFVQGGQIRMTMQVNSGGGTFSVERRRAGTTTLLLNGAPSPVSLDVPVQPGDRLNGIFTVPVGTRAACSATLQTDGGPLWPSDGAQVEGFSV